ncbi:MAG: 2,3-bisphosphoglycerate-independent phosphoglycerate mutase [Candidatus Hydrogenedentota bacterium]|nr:MAG: 2,3-bisphosphoglycerate-independent phosphoglycerate mutase [Candidatus Hydrogenedentota bacterium]
MQNIKPAILVILDGFGINPNTNEFGNAVLMANTPNFNRIFSEYPFSKLNTSGEAVGLPEGIMGNSEIGHMNIGSGRIIYSDIVRIDKAFADGSIEQNLEFKSILSYLQKTGGRLHLLGLLSDGGVHSSLDHLFHLLELFKKHKVNETYVHAFLDGRDTSPTSGVKYLQKLFDFMSKIQYGKLADIVGRYYAMDRDNRWERIEKAYRLLTEAQGDHTEANAESVVSKIKEYYGKNITDEFMEPISVNSDGVIRDGDAVLFFNFRADRARQMTQALALEDFSHFPRKKLNIHYTCMTEYKKEYHLPILFPPLEMKHLFGEVIAEAGLKQLRIAETEKYAHVTFFFNGGREEPFPGEDRILVPSPKVATYDLKPEMSAPEVTEKVVEALYKKENGRPYYSLIVLNFANGDMVGHTGVLEAAIQAVEVLDTMIGKVEEAALRNNYLMFLTADHGNCEKMCAKSPKSKEEECKPFTQHTLFPVPFVFIANESKGKKIPMEDGKLADVAPTMLNQMGLPVPKEMTGNNLIQVAAVAV